METVMVWYFLTSSVVAIGPFTTQEQCKQFAEWAYKWKYVSDCWQAPTAIAHQYSIQTHPKSSPDVR